MVIIEDKNSLLIARSHERILVSQWLLAQGANAEDE